MKQHTQHHTIITQPRTGTRNANLDPRIKNPTSPNSPSNSPTKQSSPSPRVRNRTPRCSAIPGHRRANRNACVDAPEAAIPIKAAHRASRSFCAAIRTHIRQRAGAGRVGGKKLFRPERARAQTTFSFGGDPIDTPLWCALIGCRAQPPFFLRLRVCAFFLGKASCFVEFSRVAWDFSLFADRWVFFSARVFWLWKTFASAGFKRRGNTVGWW